jgi:hypothetical protein
MDSTQQIPSGAGAEPVKEKAADLAHAAEGKARGMLDRQKETAARELVSIAGVFRDASTRLESENGPLGSCLRWAADAAQKLSGTIQGRSVDDLFDSGRRLARENPAIFVGGAALAGLIVGRVLRAGSQSLARTSGPRREGEAA